MANYNYGGRYPIHNYGSDQIRGSIQSWIQGKAQKQAALLEAIVQTAPYMKNFTPGSSDYEKVSKAFSPQVASAIAAKASDEKLRIQTQKQLNQFELGNKYLEAANKFYTMKGDAAIATSFYKNTMKLASEQFAKAGVNFKYNELISHQENMIKFKEASTEALTKVQQQVLSNKEVTPQSLNALEAALTKYEGIKGHDKDIAGAVKATITAKRKELAATVAAKRAEGLEDYKKKLKGPSKSGMEADAIQKWRDGVPLKDMTGPNRMMVESYIKSLNPKSTEAERAYADWLKKPENKGKGFDDFKKWMKQIPTFQLNKIPAQKLPAAKYNDQILNQSGFMRSEAQKMVDKKIANNPKIKADLASGKITSEQLAVTEMKPWVKTQHPSAMMVESNGKYYWVVPKDDGTAEIVADENGWVK